jgi:hypothetical protein
MVPMKKTKPGRRVAEAQVSLAGWGPTIRYLLLQLSPHAQCAVVMSAFGGATAAAMGVVDGLQLLVGLMW